MEVKFELATKSDSSEILGMMRDFNAIDNYPFNKANTERSLDEFIANQGLGRLWVIYVNTDLAGYIVLTFGFSFEYQGRDAFVDEFFVKEAYRNNGVGKKALDFVSDESHNLGINAIHLEVESHNEKANKLYEKNGYVGNRRVLLTKRVRKGEDK